MCACMCMHTCICHNYLTSSIDVATEIAKPEAGQPKLETSWL